MYLAIAASPIEVVWSVILGTGAAFSAINAWHAFADRKLRARAGLNGFRTALLDITFLQELLRFVGLLVMFSVGVISMVAPAEPVDPDPTAPTAFDIAVILGLFLAGIIMSVNAVLGTYFRLLLEQVVVSSAEQARENEHAHDAHDRMHEEIAEEGGDT